MLVNFGYRVRTGGSTALAEEISRGVGNRGEARRIHHAEDELRRGHRCWWFVASNAVFSFSMEMGGPGLEGPPGSDAAVEVSGSGEGETEQREPSRIEHQAPPVGEIPALPPRAGQSRDEEVEPDVERDSELH